MCTLRNQVQIGNFATLGVRRILYVHDDYWISYKTSLLGTSCHKYYNLEAVYFFLGGVLIVYIYMYVCMHDSKIWDWQVM